MTRTELLSPRKDTPGQAAGAEQGQSAAVLDVPERPALAPNVQLMGAMPGTGFRDQPWLIQRDGRFIQLTELLYRVAEQANGERTLDEIAEGVTAATDWIVAADDVQRLLQTKLIPLGLVAGGNGSVASGGGAAREGGPRSPLAVNLRLRTLSPRLIDPIARALQVFYLPPILVPILVAAVFAHWWLYRIHGLEASIRDAVSTPGGLLLILAIVLLAGIVHEFGHAAALRYGGGKVRAMGAGLYLIWPAFYTDVTDSYRLGRAARVRTDLGGVYFHSIFALGLIALSVALRKEILLFAVVLINLEMIRQFLPFVRLDGYWILADLTGIPDFFSQMGPFLRSLLPLPGLKGDRLPDLKPGARAVFGAYLLAVVPLLGYVFFLMLRGLPAFLTRTWASLLAQLRLFSAAQSTGDILTTVLLVTQIVLLALPALGTLFIIYSVVRIPLRVAWNWSRPTLTRRLVGAMGAAATTGFLVFLWAPQLRGLTGREPVLTNSEKASVLLKQAREATGRVQTLRANLEGSLGSDHFTGAVMLKRPNLARIAIEGKPGLGEFLVVSDGRNLFTYFPRDNRYAQSNPGPEGRNIRTFLAEPVDDFFCPDIIGAAAAGGSSNYVGRQTADGAEYDVVAVAAPGTRRGIVRYFISPEDHLIHRVVTTTQRDNGTTATSWASLKNVRTNAAADEATFRWALPPTARPLQYPSGIALPLGSSVAK